MKYLMPLLSLGTSFFYDFINDFFPFIFSILLVLNSFLDGSDPSLSLTFLLVLFNLLYFLLFILRVVLDFIFQIPNLLFSHI